MARNLVHKRNFKLVILVAAAILLLVAISKQQKIKQSASPSPSPNISTQPKQLPTTLTEDERSILNPPSVDASRSAKDQHAQTVAKLAKEGNTLEIKDCKPNPLVLQVKQGSDFKINNNDSVDRKITFDEDHVYKIPANNKLTIKAEFKYGTGDYGYICEGTGLVGFLHIAP